jgi:hypothetical protein
MNDCKLLLICSASDEKRYKTWFQGMIVHKSEDPENSFPCCLPVFRCEDRVKVRDSFPSATVMQTVVSYSEKMFSPSRHIRCGTMYGESYPSILKAIEGLKTLEDKNK